MLQSLNTLPTVQTDSYSHPFLLLDKPENAAQLKDLLLALADQEHLAEFKAILRSAANTVKEKAFGYNRKAIKNKILKLLREFERCEMIDFEEEFKLPKREIQAALDELVRESLVRVGGRQRFQEAGKHFSPVYILIQ